METERRISTGIDGLDEAIDYFRPGDTVVWQCEHISDYMYVATRFVTNVARKGDRIVMVPAFVAFTVGMALLSSVHHPFAMLASAALLGYGAGTVQSSALALAVRMAPPEKLSLANSTFYALLDIGVGIGPLILGTVEPISGYRGLFLSMAVLSIVSLALSLYVGRRNGSMRELLRLNG